jgi:outer membrane protein TolC
MRSIFFRATPRVGAALLSSARLRTATFPLLVATAFAASAALAEDQSRDLGETRAASTGNQNAPRLTLEAAVQRAVGQSRLLEANALQAGAGRDMAVAAGQLPDPTLRLGINNVPIDGADRFSLTRDFMTMRSIGVSQEFTREAKRRARSGRFEKEADVADANRVLTVTNVQRNTATAWLDRYYQERILELFVRQRDEAKLQIEAAKAAYRGGRGPLSDVFAARSAVAQLEDRIAQAQRQVAAAKVLLARWIGDAAGQRLSDPPSTDGVELDETGLDTQLLHHPQIEVMVKQEAVAQAEVQMARSNKLADWSAELMLSQRGPAYSNMISLNVSVPLQWDQKNRQDRELAAKLASVAQLRAEREDAVRAQVAETRTMLQEWRSNRARLKGYDESILPLTIERTRAAIATYRGGVAAGGTLSAVLEARRSEVESRIERLRLDMETARLWAQLHYLTPAGMETGASHRSKTGATQ